MSCAVSDARVSHQNGMGCLFDLESLFITAGPPNKTYSLRADYKQQWVRGAFTSCSSATQIDRSSNLNKSAGCN